MSGYWDYIDLYKIALKDYEELKNRFEEDKELTLQELHEKYGGMNYEECIGELFDLNYKHICATFVKDENNKVQLSETIEIYDDNDDFIGDFWTYILRKDIERFENGEIENEK